MRPDWMFEPCDPGPVRDEHGFPYEHAVRGVLPRRERVVTGYGHTEPAAYDDARQKADHAERQTTIGPRGETIVAGIAVGEAIVQGLLAGLRGSWDEVGRGS